MLKFEKNKVLTEKFNRFYPGGHSNLRVPFEATKQRLFVSRAEGSRLWDVDNNEYVDFLGGMGPNILGHRHPEYVQGLKDLLDTSTVCAGSSVFLSPDDVEVAEKLVKHVPCAEEIKFCISGSEAVQLAIRLARAYTGRKYIIRFSGHYHGWFDNVLGGTLSPNSTGKPFAFYDPNSDPWTDPAFTMGRAPGSAEESFLLPWNDIDVLENTLQKYGEEVALIHFEAQVCNHFAMPPRPGYLEKIRELCTKYGIVMSMDEIITGFRLGLSGAQGHFGVTPDIATFGKAIGGGLPLSAVVGKAEIMKQLRDKTVLSPGTFNGYALGMRGALATLKILERDNGAVYLEMGRVQKRLENGLKEIAKRRGVPLCIQGARGVFFTMFGVDNDKVVYSDDDLATLDMEAIKKFWEGMNNAGIAVMLASRWYMSIVHTVADVDKALEAADKVMATIL